MTDTSDWGHQVSQNQVLIGSFPAGATVEQVTVPDNCESLLILCGSSVSNPPEVIGITSGAIYPVIGWGLGGGYPEAWMAMVSPIIDPTVELQWNVAPISPWWVIADRGLRILGTVSNASGQAGVPFTGAPEMVAGQTGAPGFSLEPLLVDSGGRLVIAGVDPSGNYHPISMDYSGRVLPPASGILGAVTCPSTGAIVAAALNPASWVTAMSWYCTGAGQQATLCEGTTANVFCGDTGAAVGWRTVTLPSPMRIPYGNPIVGQNSGNNEVVALGYQGP